MTKRNAWLFKVTKEDLLAAVERKIAFETERLAYWLDEKGRSEAELKTDGIEFREQSVTNGTRLDVIAKPDLQARVQEATSKYNSHTETLKVYERWERALQRADAGQMFELEIDDVTFFEL